MGSSEPRPPGCMALILELLSEAYAPVVASMAACASESESRARPFAAVAYPRVNSSGRKKRRLDYAVEEPCAQRRNETLSPVRPAADPTSDVALSLFSTPSLGMPTTNEWRPCDFGASSPGPSIGVSVAEAFAACFDSSPAAAAVTAAFLAASEKPLFGGMANDERSRSSGASSPARSVAAEPIALWSDPSAVAATVKAAFLAAIKTPAFGATVDAEPPRASGPLSPGPSVLGEPAAAASPGNDAALFAAPDLPALGSPLAACIAGDLTAGRVDSVQSTCSGGGDISAAAPAGQRMPSSAASPARPAVSAAGGGDSVVVRGERGVGAAAYGTDGSPVAIGSPVSAFDRVTRTYQMFRACSHSDRPDCFGLGRGVCLAPRGLAKVLMRMRVAGKSMVALGAGNSSGRVSLAAWVLGAAKAVELEHVRGVGSSLPPANHAQQELFRAVRRSPDFEALCRASKVTNLPYDGVCRLEFRDLSALAGVPEGTDAVFLCGIGIDVATVRSLLALSARCDSARMLGVLAPQLGGLCSAEDVLLLLNCPPPGCSALVAGAWSLAAEIFLGIARALDAEQRFSSAVHRVWIFERSAALPDSAAPLAAVAPSGILRGAAAPVSKPVEPASFSTREALRAAVELWCSDRAP